MTEKQVREIKCNLCVNCGDRCCCHGIESCKDANEHVRRLHYFVVAILLQIIRRTQICVKEFI